MASKLILALYYGDLQESDENAGDAKMDSNKPHDFSVDMSLVEEELDEENRHDQQGWGLLHLRDHPFKTSANFHDF